MLALWRHPPGNPDAILLGVVLLTLGIGALVGMLFICWLLDCERMEKTDWKKK